MPFAPSPAAPWSAANPGAGSLAPGGGTATLLGPSTTITSTKNASNPTFNFDAVPESIVKVDSTYWCSYQGNWGQLGGPRDIRLASSSSVDGPWTAYGSNPVLTVGGQAWEAAITSLGANAPELYYTGGTYYIFYSCEDVNTGTYGAIGVATAGTVTGPYTKYASNPVLTPESSGWDSRRVVEPSVLYDGSQWLMAFMGEDDAQTWGRSEKIGIATASSPLGPWTKIAGNPLIDWGANGTWDDSLTADPYIFQENGYYWIWYAGGGNEDGTGSRPWSSGLAYSSSGTASWSKHTSNPIVSHGGSGAYDEKGAWRGSVYIVGNGAYSVVFGGIDAALTTVKGGNATLTVT